MTHTPSSDLYPAVCVLSAIRLGVFFWIGVALVWRLS